MSSSTHLLGCAIRSVGETASHPKLRCRFNGVAAAEVPWVFLHRIISKQCLIESSVAELASCIGDTVVAGDMKMFVSNLPCAYGAIEALMTSKVHPFIPWTFRCKNLKDFQLLEFDAQVIGVSKGNRPVAG